jgi:hypothetical protein
MLAVNEQYRARVGMLADWAARDVDMARKQTRLDMKVFPGIEHEVARQLEIRAAFGQLELPDDWPALFDQLILPAGVKK